MKNNNIKGFTLIELLATLTIIMILLFYASRYIYFIDLELINEQYEQEICMHGYVYEQFFMVVQDDFVRIKLNPENLKPFKCNSTNSDGTTFEIIGN